MKRLAILAAIIATTVTTNAAQALWDLDTVYTSDGTGNVADGYLVYYFDTMNLSVADAQTSIAAADFSFLSKGQEAYDLLDSGYAEGSSGGIYNPNDSVNGYLVIFDANTTDSASAAFVSGVESATVNQLGANVSLSFGDLDNSLDKANWTPIPEPTSGILLVLGMAGLALRRKNA